MAKRMITLQVSAAVLKRHLMRVFKKADVKMPSAVLDQLLENPKFLKELTGDLFAIWQDSLDHPDSDAYELVCTLLGEHDQRGNLWKKYAIKPPADVAE